LPDEGDCRRRLDCMGCFLRGKEQSVGNSLKVQIVVNLSSTPREQVFSGFTGSGFYSLSIIYATFTAFSWIAPSVMVVLGLKITMFVGAVIYALFVATFFQLNNGLLYSASALLGLGAALIWTAQVRYIKSELHDHIPTLYNFAGCFPGRELDQGDDVAQLWNLLGNAAVQSAHWKHVCLLPVPGTGRSRQGHQGRDGGLSIRSRHCGVSGLCPTIAT
jgi:hypothetical protein